MRRDRGSVRRAPTGLILGVALVAAAFAIRAASPAFAGWGVPDRAQDTITLALSVIIESAPFVFLGILLSTVVQVWLPHGFITRFLPRQPLLRRACISLLGMFFPVCECGNVPLARGFMVGGFTVPESITFLLAAPILNPITIITTHQAFGWGDGILLTRIVAGFVIANVIGWLFSRHPNPDSLLTRTFSASCAVPGVSGHDNDQHEGHSHPPGARPGRIERSVDLFTRETAVIMPALFLGSLIAALTQVFVPRSVLLALGSNPVWSVLAMMALAFIVAVCSNVDAFFVLSFGSTFMPGGIASFLTFGAMIDVKMLALMRTTFTTRTLVQITALVALMSAAAGLLVNYVA
ncbi:permease [Cryobacterium adonitolivorans]|uniref:Permease n=1 Tax=Cryobacterium adonitolivorans TaxID=1259189 RepID=A0A4R8VYC3_9MICO|nr:permease [Cryobacterium adonitolivorans]TFB97782.1 permease [Cryobacterium adonitolivorans]